MTCVKKLHFCFAKTVTVLIVLSILTYVNCLQNQFVYDDTTTIADNQFITKWGNIPYLFTPDYFKYSGELSYRPVVTLSYFLDYSVWHNNPMGYHAVNVLLHSLNVVMIYFFVFLLFDKIHTYQIPQKIPRNSKPEPRHSAAFLTSIFFATHPVVTEVVNAISFREDLLATLFFLSSFILFLQYKDQTIIKNSYLVSPDQNKRLLTRAKRSHKKTTILYIAVIVTYFLGLFSKESVITLPFLVFIHELLFNTKVSLNSDSAIQEGSDQQQKKSGSFLKKSGQIIFTPVFIGYMGISIVFFIIRFICLLNPLERLSHSQGHFFSDILTSMKVLCWYIVALFLPMKLNIDYHVSYLKSPLSLSFLIALFLLAAVTVITVRINKKRTFHFSRTLHKGIENCKSSDDSVPFGANAWKQRLCLFGTAWFFVAVIPVMNIIPLQNIMADRYLYLPLIGYCLLLSVMVKHVTMVARYPLILFILIFYISISVTRNNVWYNEFTLWQNSSKSSLCSFTTYNNLGTQYKIRGYFDIALQYYRKAIQKAQEIAFYQYADPYFNMANVYGETGRLSEAIQAYEQAILLKPDYKQAYYNLGKVYFELGRYNDSFRAYNKVIEIDPDFAEAYNNIGVIYERLDKKKAAILAYKKAISSDPNHSNAYYNLGNIYKTQKEYASALEAYSHAIKTGLKQANVHNSLGTIYETVGNVDVATEEYKRAIELDPTYPYAYNNLALLFGRKGEFEKAIHLLQKAVELLPDRSEFRYNLGYAYYCKGDLERALEEYETVLSMEPSHAETLLQTGIIFYKQGATKKALAAWQKILRTDPDHTTAKEYIRSLQK